MDLVGGHEAFCLVRRIPLFFFFLDWGGLRYMDGSGRYLDDI